jgi:diadenosine tetraphosphatase ApaH/serine/threonine PP2A family protein phosphatase
MNWTELDWPALDRLRDGFLHGGAAPGPYWRTESALASYDLTFGERIGWKWDHVLQELSLRAWRPSVRSVFDWGCGSGIAGRRAINAFGVANFDELIVWDHEALATDFAATAARRAFPGLRVSQATPGYLQSGEPIGLLVLSHVLNELSAEQLAALRDLMARAQAVLWVEPGTHEISRGLGAILEALRADFQVIAPCTHQGSCPVLAANRERDWCHQFAFAPSEIFANPNWVKFGQRAGIDLRSLPYAFLVVDRKPTTLGPGWSHIVGRPEHFKPYARFLNCDATGLHQLTVPKRQTPALFKELGRTRSPLIYRWAREGTQISAGESIATLSTPTLD